MLAKQFGFYRKLHINSGANSFSIAGGNGGGGTYWKNLPQAQVAGGALQHVMMTCAGSSCQHSPRSGIHYGCAVPRRTTGAPAATRRGKGGVHTCSHGGGVFRQQLRRLVAVTAWVTWLPRHRPVHPPVFTLLTTAWRKPGSLQSSSCASPLPNTRVSTTARLVARLILRTPSHQKPQVQ